MAYVVASKTVLAITSASSNTATMPAGVTILADDLIAILVTHRTSSAHTIGVTGYTGVNSQQTNDSVQSRWFVLKVTGTPPTTATLTFSAATGNVLSYAIYIIRDADVSVSAAGAIDGSNFNAGGTAGTCSSPSLTTGSADCLLLHGVAWDDAYVYADPADVQVGAVGYQIGTGVGYKATAGAIGTYSWRSDDASNAGLSWVLAIKNASGGTLPIRVSDGRDVLYRAGGYDAALNAAPNAVSGLTAINGTNMGTALGTISTGAPTLGYTAAYSTFASSENLAALAWVGGFSPTFTAKNLTGRQIPIAVFTGAANNNPTVLGDQGVIVVLVDSSNNWAAYSLVPFNQIAASSAYFRSIQVGGTTILAGSGTPLNQADVIRFGFFYERRNGVTNTATFGFYTMLYDTDPSVFVGGGAEWPITVERLYEALYCGGLWNQQFQFQGTGQFVAKQDLRLGNGTDATYVKFQGQSFEFPSAKDTTWSAAIQTQSLDVYASASDTMNFAASIIATNTRQSFTINSSSSTSAAYSFVGASFIGYDVTWKTGVECTGVTFAGCYELDMKGADLINCTISDTANTDSAITFTEDGGSMDGCTIDGTGAAYAIELGTAVTAITLTDCAITAGSTDKIHVLKTTGTVTITISGTTSLVAGDVTTEGATVVISGPTINQSVTVSGMVAGSGLEIYDYGVADTQLYNGIPGTTSYTWTDPTPAAAQRDIRIRITYQSGATAKKMIEANIGSCGIAEGTEAVPYLANQTDDLTYNANAVDGSTVTGMSIVDATDRMQISIAGGVTEWKDIYAYQVYWLHTNAGREDDFAFIEAIDPANYLLTQFKIKNTHPTAPLEIINGYGRDATTGSVRDIMDLTGGFIFPSPDHVVSSVVTVSGVNVITGDIADVPTASENADAVFADSRALTVGKFLGLK